MAESCYYDGWKCCSRCGHIQWHEPHAELCEFCVDTLYYLADKAAGVPAER